MFKLSEDDAPNTCVTMVVGRYPIKFFANVHIGDDNDVNLLETFLFSDIYVINVQDSNLFCLGHEFCEEINVSLIILEGMRLYCILV